MRFNCQSCAAKYLIADEKVAGKTVRMKCRKCGAAIQVRPLPNGEAAYVGDSASPSVSMVPPSDHTESLVPRSERPLLPSAPPPTEPPLSRRVPLGPSITAPQGAPASVAPRALPPPSALPRLPLPGAPPLANRTLPPLPGAGARPSVGPPRPALPPFGAVPPLPPVGPGGVSAAPLPGPVLAIPGPLPFPDAPGVPSSRGPAVRSATESVPLPQLSDPLVLTKVKESAGVLPGLAGEPRRDSGDPLGGFEDKAPVPVAEGAPFVQPGIEAPVTAPLAEPDSADPAGRPKLEVADEATALFQLPALGAAAAVPAEAAAAPAGSPMPDLSGNAAPPLEAVPLPTAFDGISQPTEVLESFDAQALAAAAREGASVAEAVAPPVEVSPPVVERASDVPEPASLTDVADHDRRKRHRGIHPAAWGLIAMCAALGGVAAWIFLSPSPPSKDAVASVASSRVVTVSTAGHSELHGPAASASAAGAGAVPTSDQAGLPAGAGALGAQPEVAGGTTSGVAPIAGTPSGAVVPDKSDKPGAKVAAPCDPKTDPLCSAVGGPDAGAGPGGRADSGAGLTQEQISATVSRNRGGVQRGCIPLVQSGAVKVNVTMTIGPSGNVSAVSTSGGGGNSGVVACIRSKVSGWHFPASGGTTQVSVPFQLIAQN